MSSRFARGALGFLVSAGLLWWVLHDASLPEVWSSLRRADAGLLTASVAVVTLGYGLRAVRWLVLLGPNRDVDFQSRFAAVCIGFMANNVFPARIGEFARAYSLDRISGVQTSEAFASVVVERVLDGVVVAFLLSVSISIPGFFPAGLSEGSIVRDLATGGAALFATLLGGLWLLARSPDYAVRAFRAGARRFLRTGLLNRGGDTVVAFVKGLGTLRDPGLFFQAVVWSLVIWLWLATSIWLGLQAFEITGPGLLGAVVVQSLLAFAVAVPSSPGSFGPFEAAAKLGLGLYGVSSADALALAGSYHLLVLTPVTLLGFWYVRRAGVSWSEMKWAAGEAERD